MNLRQAAQQALEALADSRRSHHYCEDTWYSCPKHEGGCANEAEGDECNCGADKANEKIDQAITAIEQALAEPEQKPVAWYCNQGLKRGVSLKQESPEWMPLYTALRAALAEPRPIQECYGDCPTNPQTCPNPCNFEGRPKPEQNPFGDDAERYARKLHEECEYYKALYTAPTPRKPLTDKEIAAIASTPCAVVGSYVHTFARALERAHGIGEQT